MQARLILLDPPAAQRELKLTLPATIGRSREARIKIVHSQVSRQHCEFFERDGLLHVRDLGSTNGTYVGEKRIEESLVRPGDTITIGAVKVQALYEPAEGAVLPPSEKSVAVATDTVRAAGEGTFRAGQAGTPLKRSEDSSDTAATAAFAPIPFDDDSLLPIEESEAAPAAPPPAIAASEIQPNADDDSLDILPMTHDAEAAASEPPPTLEWRVPEPSSPVETDFAFHLEESPDQAIEPPHQPAAQEQPPDKPTSQEEDDFEKFLKSLE